MQYPLNFSFKVLSISPQIEITDASGAPVLFVRQKIFKLKESVQVYTDAERQNLIFQIDADRVIDFSARYQFRDASGENLGSVKRKGMRSIWRTDYRIFDESDTEIMEIREENPWAKVADSFFGEIPFLGALSGYLFHPSYRVSSSSGQQFLRMRKLPAFFEGKFVIEELQPMDSLDAYRALLALTMMILLERDRG